MPVSPPLTVVLADGHARYRDALADALASWPGVVIAAQEDDGPSALRAVARLRPRALVIDAGTDGEDGLAVCRRLVADPGAPAVVLLTASPTEALARDVEAAGARGLLAKDLPRAAAVARILALVAVV